MKSITATSRPSRKDAASSQPPDPRKRTRADNTDEEDSNESDKDDDDSDSDGVCPFSRSRPGYPKCRKLGDLKKSKKTVSRLSFSHVTVGASTSPLSQADR